MNETIATIRKNRREEVRISLTENHGRRIFRAELLRDLTGDGVTIVHRHIAFQVDLLPAFAEAVATALERTSGAKNG